MKKKLSSKDFLIRNKNLVKDVLKENSKLILFVFAGEGRNQSTLQSHICLFSIAKGMSY